MKKKTKNQKKGKATHIEMSLCLPVLFVSPVLFCFVFFLKKKDGGNLLLRTPFYNYYFF